MVKVYRGPKFEKSYDDFMSYDKVMITYNFRLRLF